MHNVYKCLTEWLSCNRQYRINVCISQSYTEKTQRLAYLTVDPTVDLNLNGNMPNHTTAVLSLLHPKPAWSSLVVPMHLKLGCPGYLFEIFLLLLLFKKKKRLLFFKLFFCLQLFIVCVSVGVRGQLVGVSFLSIMSVPGIRLWLSGFLARVFTHWTSSLVPVVTFKNQISEWFLNSVLWDWVISWVVALPNPPQRNLVASHPGDLQ